MNGESEAEVYAWGTGAACQAFGTGGWCAHEVDSIRNVASVMYNGRLWIVAFVLAAFDMANLGARGLIGCFD